MNETNPNLSHQFALSAALGNDRSIQINGVFSKTDTMEDMNRQLDMLWSVTERLWARNHVVGLKMNLVTAQRVKADTEAAYQTAWKEASKFLDAKKLVPTHLKVDQETHIQAMRQHESEIARIEAQIAYWEQKAA